MDWAKSAATDDQKLGHTVDVGDGVEQEVPVDTVDVVLDDVREEVVTLVIGDVELVVLADDVVVVADEVLELDDNELLMGDVVEDAVLLVLTLEMVDEDGVPLFVVDPMLVLADVDELELVALGAQLESPALAPAENM